MTTFECQGICDNVAIEVVQLSKLYRIGSVKGKPTNLREALTLACQEPIKRIQALRHGYVPTNADQEFWALKDVSFSINKGDSVAIMGVNGSGKSTLLKTISHIIEPTSGFVRTRGRIVSLLDVGAGFHPELTGQENIYLNATVFGMTKTEIDTKYPEIVEFAELRNDFLQTPLKRYSSGMRVRLGFAVAIHANANILIMDEVLAVGDAGFREKCFEKLGQIKESGITILIVSHFLSHVKRLADTIIWLKEGRVYRIGSTDDLANAYNDEVVSKRRKEPSG